MSVDEKLDEQHGEKKVNRPYMVFGYGKNGEEIRLYEYKMGDTTIYVGDRRYLMKRPQWLQDEIDAVQNRSFLRRFFSFYAPPKF